MRPFPCNAVFGLSVCQGNEERLVRPFPCYTVRQGNAGRLGRPFICYTGSNHGVRSNPGLSTFKLFISDAYISIVAYSVSNMHDSNTTSITV